MTRALGWRADPFDFRDKDAGQLLSIAPVKALPLVVGRSPFTKVLQQGGLGACTCNAAAQIVRAAELAALVERDRLAWLAGGNMAQDFNLSASLAHWQGLVEFFSRLMAYYLARAAMHQTGIDAGTYLRLVFKILNTFGFCPESVWQYSDNADPRTGAFAKMPSGEAFRQAYDQRLAADAAGVAIVEYARIPETGHARVDACKRAMADGFLIGFGTDVTEDFCEDMGANDGKPIDPPSTTAKIAGGHALTMGGYNQDGPDILNSWGKEFGDQGWFRMTWDYVAWSRTSDLWICKRVPLFSGAKEAA